MSRNNLCGLVFYIDSFFITKIQQINFLDKKRNHLGVILDMNSF